MDNWTHSMKCGVLTGTITACLATPTEQEAFFLFVTMCLRLDTHYGGGRGRRAGGEWHTHRVLLESLPGKNNSPSFQWCVCVQHLGFLLPCDKHTQRRGDLYARGAMENCLLRDAALMSSLHVSTKPLGGDGRTEDWGFVLCHQRDCDHERSAVQYPSVSQRPLQRGRDAVRTHKPFNTTRTLEKCR